MAWRFVRGRFSRKEVFCAICLYQPTRWPWLTVAGGLSVGPPIDWITFDPNDKQSPSGPGSLGLVFFVDPSLHADLPVSRKQQALQRCQDLEQGQPDYLLKMLNLMQGARYLEILSKDGSQERFARGWLNRVDLR